MSEVSPRLFSFLLAVSAVRLTGATDVHVPLAGVGQTAPIVFESVRDERSVYLALPRDTLFQSGVLRLELQWSPVLRQPSNLRVTVENTATRVIPLTFGSDAPVRIDIPLDAALLSRRTLAVRLAATTLASHDLCLDEKLRPGFLQILPASGLVLRPYEQPATVPAFLDRLPADVVVAVPPGPPQLPVWRAAWELTTLLAEKGHAVRLARTPDPAHIVIAADQPGLVVTPGGPVLRVTPATLAAGQLAPDWPRPPSKPARDLQGQPLRIGLDALHPGSTLRDTSWRAEWDLRPPLLPPGYRVTRANIRIAQTPVISERPVQLFVYADGVLAHTFRLAEKSDPQELRFELPPSDNVRVMSQRTPASGECMATVPPTPSQLLPGTALTATPVPPGDPTLPGATHLLRGPARIYVDSRAAAAPESLPALASIIRRLGLEPAQTEVRIVTSGSRPAADRPFVLIATDAPPGLISPVRFDRGDVTLTDALGRTLLRTPAAPETTVVQAIGVGVWIRPAAGLTTITELDLGQGDVAFLDGAGLVRGFHSRQVEIAQVRYTNLTTWTDWMADHSVWLFGAAWLIVTVVFVGLYRRLLRHKELA